MDVLVRLREEGYDGACPSDLPLNNVLSMQWIGRSAGASLDERLDPLEHLRRPDKWFLGGGKGAMFAPEFPKWLREPGFWDESYFVDLRLERLFHVFVCDERGRPIEWITNEFDWRPDRLITNRVASNLEMTETRVVTEDHVFASRISFRTWGSQDRRLHLLFWSLQEKRQPTDDPYVSAQEVTVRDGELTWRHHIHGAASDGDLFVILRSSAERVSYMVNAAEPTDISPNWRVSVFGEKFRDFRLPDEEKGDGFVSPFGHPNHVHIAQHYAIDLWPDEPHEITFCAAVGYSAEEARAAAKNACTSNVVQVSEQAWRKYFESVPYFECSDEKITRYYWYRWYGLRLLTVDVARDPFPSPCVFEGIGYFRDHITYSAQCHMREGAWMRDPSLAAGSLLGEIANQNDDGSFPGHIYSHRPPRGFYHANWGRSVLDHYALTGDDDFLSAVYEPLARYADYFERERDQGAVHLYDVLDQGETGQEYMSRYLFVDERADQWGRISLKGVDATFYIYELQRALAFIAVRLGLPDVWSEKATQTKRAVAEYMWDPELELHCDLAPGDLRKSPFKSATCFYPFWTDLAEPEHVRAIQRHLLNRDEFLTTWPTPACSVDDPYFSAEAEWKGKRTNCPWNGRSWPMTNSHVCEALAGAARQHDPSLRPAAAQFIARFIHMMFTDSDPKRPNCWEHYNPFTGQGCEYRGVDDYQHSWVIDLIMRHLVGLRPGLDGSLTVDPLPFGLEWFRMEGALIRGRTVDVIYDKDTGLLVRVDGDVRANGESLGELKITDR